MKTKIKLLSKVMLKHPNKNLRVFWTTSRNLHHHRLSIQTSHLSICQVLQTHLKLMISTPCRTYFRPWMSDSNPRLKWISLPLKNQKKRNLLLVQSPVLLHQMLKSTTSTIIILPLELVWETTQQAASLSLLLLLEAEALTSAPFPRNNLPPKNHQCKIFTQEIQENLHQL